MGILIDRKWIDNDESYRRGGAFVRPATAYRSFITADGSSPFPVEAGRYHLYVANPCPWCHRTTIFHALKRLEGVVSIGVVNPLLLEGGWKFNQPDPIIVVQQENFVFCMVVFLADEVSSRSWLLRRTPPRGGMRPAAAVTPHICPQMPSALVRPGRASERIMK